MHSNRLHQIAVVFMLFGIILVSSNSYLRPSRVITSCCKRVSSKRIPYNVTHYRIQNALAPCVEAVIFYTVEKGAICSNPVARWVPRKIREINDKMEIGSA
ncbi:eotaxin-like [Scyliorhinus canicula]|uniref:Small inducible cytokine SCYA107 n=1 Tax=Scyliorhinus canicula TaxID=7830 RepID=Q802H0_SCYCA|nr:eotaxin-like [Scyliorhinus canicula]AAO21210.1 small inducible cytokine SCYA107 [Scyliorhinus canicula]